MSWKFPVSGSNATDINPATASSATPLLVPTSGRVFWLRGVTVRASATQAKQVRILNASSGGTATSFALVLTIPYATGLATLGPAVDPADVVINFGPPGLRFTTACSANSSATTVITQFEVAVWGYEQ